MLMRVLCGVLLTCLPQTGLASSCSVGELSDDAFASAKHVFVFRVIATEIREATEGPPGYELGQGHLRVVESLRGDAPYESFVFNTHGSCGSKLVPGHYYLGIGSDPERFVAGPSTVLDLSGSYREGINNAQGFIGFNKLVSAASGQVPLSHVQPPHDRLPIMYLPPPPPPPPDCSGRSP